MVQEFSVADVYNYIEPEGVIVTDTTGAILQEVITEYQDAFGQDLVVPNTANPQAYSSPQGLLITAEALARQAVADNNAMLANQINPNIAGGVFLDAIMALTGLQRAPAEQSSTLITLNGAAGTSIPAGSQLQDIVSGNIFETLNTYIIGANGTVQATLLSVEYGPININNNTTWVLISSVLGWETATNNFQLTLGTITQSDVAARAYRLQAIAIQGSSIAGAIIAAVYVVINQDARPLNNSIPSVKYLENETSGTLEIEGVTMVANSIYLCVNGGDEFTGYTAVVVVASGTNGTVITAGSQVSNSAGYVFQNPLPGTLDYIVNYSSIGSAVATGTNPPEICQYTISGTQYLSITNYSSNTFSTYVWGGSSFSSIGSAVATGTGPIGICAYVISGTQYISIVNAVSNTFSTYSWGGSAFSSIGSAVATGVMPSEICQYTISGTQYLSITNSTDNTFSTYAWGGSSFSLISGGTVSTGIFPVGICSYAISGTQYISIVNQDDNTFSTYYWNGTTFVLITNGVVATGMTPSEIVSYSISGNQYISIVNSAANTFNTYIWNGTGFVSIGSPVLTGTSPYRLCQYTNLGTQYISISNQHDNTFSTYYWNGTTFILLCPPVTTGTFPSGICSYAITGKQYISLVNYTGNTFSTFVETFGAFITFDALQSGPIPVPIGSVTTIVTPISGWAAVTNYANETSLGNQSDVAYAIMSKKSAGCSYNNGPGINISAVVIEPNSGQYLTVLYDNPNPIPIYITVNVVIVTPVQNPQASIQQAILTYVQGGLNGVPGWGVGQNVSAFEIAGAITTQLPGVYVKSLFTKISSGPTSSDEIVITDYQIAITGSGYIVVNVLS